MCRWAAYHGTPIFMEDVVTTPEHSLIKQSQDASECKTSVNGDGIGLAWYGEHKEPCLYRDIQPAWSNCNVLNLVRQVRSRLFLSHVRASTGSAITQQNCHPFTYANLSFMHNGQIRDFQKICRKLEAHLSDELYAARLGSTDSELIFLLAIQNGLGENPHSAFKKTICLIERVAREAGLIPLLRFAAAFSDGITLHAIRYSTDHISPSIYYSSSRVNNGTCIVSEPFDLMKAGWHSLNPNCILCSNGNKIDIQPFFAPVHDEAV